MTRLLAVFAHPDDEGAVAGTLTHYSQRGVHISLACTTRGESGEISDPSLASPDNLGSVRERELRCAADIIGVHELHFLNYCDSGMKGTADNDLPTAFIQAEPDEVRAKLVKIIRQTKPHALITFEPFGWYGHPDHVATSRYTTEAFQLAADSTFLPNGEASWQPLRLFHALLDLDQFGIIFDYARDNSLDTGGFDALRKEIAHVELPPVSHRLNVEEHFPVIEEATRCHQTQFGPDNLLYQVPREVRRLASRIECFSQIYPSIEPNSAVSQDLFANIDPQLLR